MESHVKFITFLKQAKSMVVDTAKSMVVDMARVEVGTKLRLKT